MICEETLKSCFVGKSEEKRTWSWRADHREATANADRRAEIGIVSRVHLIAVDVVGVVVHIRDGSRWVGPSIVFLITGRHI